MTTRKKNILSGILILAWALVMFLSTRNLSSMVDISIGPELVPRWVAGLLAVLGLCVLVQGLRAAPEEEREKGKESSSPREETEKDPVRRHLPAVTFGLLFLYVYLLKPLGFILSSIAYLTFQITFLSGDYRKKNWLRSFLIGVVTAFLSYAVFRKGLGLLLPRGLLGF